MVDRRRDVRLLIIADIGAGLALPGCQISIARVAERLRVSPIPVREALSRLAGEGLLFERPGAGFFVPRLHAHQLAELYRLRGMVIMAATAAAVGSLSAIGRSRTNGPWRAIDPLLDGIVADAGDQALAKVWAYTDFRLLPYRRCEAVPDAVELAGVRDLLEATGAQHGALVRRLVGQHIRRRILRCEELVRRATAPDINNISPL